MFQNSHQNSSEEDVPDKRMFSINDHDELEYFMSELMVQLQTFPYDEALENSKELDSINIHESYKKEGVAVKNKETSIDIHTMETSLEEKGAAGKE